MDNLCEMMQTGASLEQCERETLFSTLHELESCGAHPSVELLTRITASFQIYLDEIKWERGPEAAITAKGYIEFFLKETTPEQKFVYALRAHQLIIAALTN
tara:strand:+ start:178 stop:480 length:303 start_codon:yes stop_codon:yes gene_type:complete